MPRRPESSRRRKRRLRRSDNPDLGATKAGLVGNSGWASLLFELGNELELGAGIDGAVDLALYLGGRNYLLLNGGALIATTDVQEPAGLLSLLVGLGALALRRRPG